MIHAVMKLDHCGYDCGFDCDRSHHCCSPYCGRPFQFK